MKKFYLSLIGLSLCGSLISQTAFNMQDHLLEKGFISPYTKVPQKAPLNTDRSASFNKWIEVVGDVMTNKGLDLTSTTPNQGFFLDVVNCDSTVKVSGTTTRSVSTIMMGTILDPKSSYLDPSLTPLVTNTEPYYIDSLCILGSYLQINPAVSDTLYTWVVWGDSTTASTVFKKRTDASIWAAPIGTWRYEIIGPKVSGAIGAAGNKVKASAPASNMVLVKYVLTAADVASGAGMSSYIYIPLPHELSIPAGNIVSCFYTFVPGAVPPVGSVSYSFPSAPDPQTVNGFAGMIWGQTNPAVAALSDYVDQQVDPSSWCMGASYSKSQRHAVYPASYDNSLFGDLLSAPVILYKVNNTSTGINEINNNFALLQNQPNPFKENTTVSYQLAKPAKQVSLEIFDVRGVKVYENNESNQKAGSYSFNVNNVKFTSGIYLYSLTVDGAKITKKMIVE